MVMLKSKTFLRMCVFLLAVVVIGVCSGSPTLALKDSLYNRYAQNSIYFYDPDASAEDCDDKDGDGGGGPTKDWDGRCFSVDGYRAQFDKFFDTIYKVARNNSLPWEGIVAQMIGESSFGKHEACPYNPLGLKGSPSCGGGYKIFGSYEEAFTAYVNNYRPVREAKGKFTNDPYGYIDFLINGVPGYKYATDPDYVNKISAYVCGVQKWAKAHGKPISGSGPKEIEEKEGDKDDEDDDDGASPYCSDDDDDDDDDDEEDEDGDCEEKGTCDDYVFPLKGATKSNYLHHSALSPLPCGNLSRGGCHHDYWAMDLGLSTGTKTESDFPDLRGKFSAEYWKSVGVKVVAMTSGKITSYKHYGRATMGYSSKCASVTYETNDGRKFWLGHMSYDSTRKAGDTFGTGDVIGEVGPPPCAVGTQAHLHVDETLKYGSSGSVETVKLINMLYSRLP